MKKSSLLKPKTGLNSTNTKAKDKFDGAESRYDLNARELFDLN
jgi:hypothetical protein